MFTAKHRIIDDIDIESIQDYESSLVNYMNTNQKELMAELKDKKAISKELEEKLLKVIKEFTLTYLG